MSTITTQILERVGLETLVESRNSLKNGRAWVEIDLDRLKSNLKKVTDWIGPDRKVLVAVKADAYGHSSLAVSRALAEQGVDMLGVASLEEAIELKRGGAAVELVILSPSSFLEIPEIVAEGFVSTVSNMEYARRLSAVARAANRRMKVHVEVDTGMGRTGVNYACAADFVQQLAEAEFIQIEGIFTHFADAERSDKSFVFTQLERFNRVLDELRKRSIAIPLIHAANSAALLDVRESHFNMVRPGLVIYGIYPSGYADRHVEVESVMTFKARVAHLNRIRKGESVSYGRTYVAQRDMTVAVVSVGYGDGYPRALSNRGEVLIAGRRHRIVGVVCMDLTMVDVTDRPDVSIGDEVVLMGKSGAEEITASEIAELADTISYDVICSVGPRVPRVFIKRGIPVEVKSLVGVEEL
jgi:alanine racemase